ncbi:MAG TPA: hypothetical protein VG295_12420 [Solirubrobacteraceae bacterium]|nr:hypothetical protein [Solirubrobacteraceae bacterium]
MPAQKGQEGGHGALNGLAPVASVNDGIAGMSAMRGLMLYGAVLAFTGLYIDFIVVISSAKSGIKPNIDATLISTAAALSGVLGSAFALKIGVRPSAGAVNRELAAHAARAQAKRASTIVAGFRRALSLEPSGSGAKSWPLTFGIWAYAIVASSVVAAYILNQNETPGAVKALAVTFGGYVIALINMAYGMTRQGDG